MNWKEREGTVHGTGITMSLQLFDLRKKESQQEFMHSWPNAQVDECMRWMDQMVAFAEIRLWQEAHNSALECLEWARCTLDKDDPALCVIEYNEVAMRILNHLEDATVTNIKWMHKHCCTVLGTMHSCSQCCLAAVGYVYWNKHGDSDKAIKCYSTCLENRLKMAQSCTYESVVWCFEQLIDLLSETHRWKEAKRLISRATDFIESMENVNLEHLLNLSTKRASIFLKQQQFNLAMDVLESAIHEARWSPGENQKMKILLTVNLGIVCIHAGKSTDAKTHFLHAVDLLQATPWSNDMNLILAVLSLVKAFDCLEENFCTAYLAEVYEPLFRKTLGRNHPFVRELLN